MSNVPGKDARRVCVKVYGRVQGVGFRYWAQRVAEDLQLTGFVRNEHDGTVLVEAQADEPVLKQFLQQLESGDGLIRVDRLKIDWVNPQEHEDGFHIRF
jgi:acylphosphatase